MKRIILAIAFFGIISSCVLTAGGAGIVAIGMPALQSPTIHGVIVGRLQVNRGAITAKSLSDLF